VVEKFHPFLVLALDFCLILLYNNIINTYESVG
jgi:hypothetical protein